MKRIIMIMFLVVLSINNTVNAQDQYYYDLILKAIDYYRAGEFNKSEQTLLKIIKPESKARPEYMVVAYNTLAINSLGLGNFDKSLEFNFKAESYITDPSSVQLADLYNNRGHLLSIKKSYDVAREYLEKSIRIYTGLGSREISVIQSLNAAYINISIVCIETKQYQQALNYLEMSVSLSSECKLSQLAFTFLNLAKTYTKLGNREKAGQFYRKSIEQFRKDLGEGYYRMSDVYLDYSLFLRTEGKYSEALDNARKALRICINSYPGKHTLTSLSYKQIGDIYAFKQKYDSSLYYYQKSLIAVVPDFNDQDFFSNPSIDSSLFDIRLLDDLKNKARVLGLMAGTLTDQHKRQVFLEKSVETSDLAIQLIGRIRNSYMSEESRIYLADNEKETYISGVSLTAGLYALNHDKNTMVKMYSTAQKAKSAILSNEILQNDLLYSGRVPELLRNRLTALSGEIEAYTNLILAEGRKQAQNHHKIALWKDNIFNLNREEEKVRDSIDKVFPAFHEIIVKTEPVKLAAIQKHLSADETIIDYLLSNNYNEGHRQMFIFLISRDSLQYIEEKVDSSFTEQAGIIKNTADPAFSSVSFKDYSGSLYHMYINLIRPVEDRVSGNKLIIIPDEEIGWLSFDAFIKNSSSPGNNFDGVKFLINDYTFSYAYSSSLIFSKQLKNSKPHVLSFSPYYGGIDSLSSLKGSAREIKSIYKHFEGHNFEGSNATKTAFLQSLKDSSILHLVMHSKSDSLNSKYSFLLFEAADTNPDEGKLYNYEIGLSRIKSPMVVLSACNSGIGTLYYGEGMMSLSRGFTLAGASSVIKTAWDINDETSAAIMAEFYNQLSKGRQKNVAMRLAKLEYLKKSSPSLKNPYYWAAYEVLGDNSPVAENKTMMIAGVIILAFAVLIIYFSRRRIFSERS